MNVVMIVPTGIGCSIGGHAGDATPAAKVLAEVCETLILHPNVVNASDINEMPSNSLYVEGSMLDKMLEGDIRLQRPIRGNHILVVCNEITPNICNGVAAARHTLGLSYRLQQLPTPLEMIAETGHYGEASGSVYGVDELVSFVSSFEYDALAVVTPIEVSDALAMKYSNDGGINPWGGVEAVASKMIARRVTRPVAHAPYFAPDDPMSKLHVVVDPSMAAEYVSVAYLFCIMKGLQYAPQIVECEDRVGIGVDNIDVLVSPVNCWNRPHNACTNVGIPIITVASNQPIVCAKKMGICTEVANYAEAAGLIVAMKANVSSELL